MVSNSRDRGSLSPPPAAVASIAQTSHSCEPGNNKGTVTSLVEPVQSDPMGRAHLKQNPTMRSHKQGLRDVATIATATKCASDDSHRRGVSFHKTQRSPQVRDNLQVPQYTHHHKIPREKRDTHSAHEMSRSKTIQTIDIASKDRRTSLHPGRRNQHHVGRWPRWAPSPMKPLWESAFPRVQPAPANDDDPTRPRAR